MIDRPWEYDTGSQKSADNSKKRTASTNRFFGGLLLAICILGAIIIVPMFIMAHRYPEAALGPGLAVVFTLIILIPIAGIVLFLWVITALVRSNRSLTRNQRQNTPR